LIVANRSLLTSVVLSLITAGSWWLAQRAETQIPYRPQPHSPDYYLNDFSAITTGADGQPEKRLRARRMVHYPDDDSTELVRPRMTFYQSPDPPWRIRSDSGWIAGNKEQVLLQGEVNIDRDGGANVRPMHIITRDLRIRPDDDYAETEAAVHARSDRSWIEAEGMQAWFAGPVRIKLLANARGRYEME